MSTKKVSHHVSTETYLQNELLADIKHQLIDDEVYAMAGASENHNLLALNIASELKNQLKGTPCRTFMADMKVSVADDFYYPDVMVVCAADNENEYYKKSPVIIVEVLSKTTRKFDQTSKRLRCQAIPTLEEYVLIEQDKGEIQVFSRNQNWQSLYYYLGDRITFQSLGITVSVEDIYYQVNNEDVLAFLEQKQQS
jgi:Uma2 family endonuclease